MSGSVLLRELVRIDVAKELTMTARVFDGAQALGYGLVTRVCADPLTEALELGRELGARSPDAVAAAKRLFHTTWAASEARALEVESELQRALIVPPLQNTMAAATIGLGLPMQLSFKDRQSFWRGAEE